MPLFIAEYDKEYNIIRVGGDEKTKHYLEGLGFVTGESITVISKLNHYFLVGIKGSRIGISDDLARKIVITEETRYEK